MRSDYSRCSLVDPVAAVVVEQQRRQQQLQQRPQQQGQDSAVAVSLVALAVYLPNCAAVAAVAGRFAAAVVVAAAETPRNEIELTPSPLNHDDVVVDECVVAVAAGFVEDAAVVVADAS